MPPQDPENYSLDEMLQRLKRREPADREELVMRPDGSQVIKRRNRKRRSVQTRERRPPRSSQGARFIKLAATLGILLALLLGGFGRLAYFNSSAFVTKTEQTLGRLSGADVKLDRFGLSPLRAQVRAVDLSWSDDGFMRAGRFDNVAAKINPLSFVGASWGGEELLAGDGLLRFGAPLASNPPPGGGGKPEASPYRFMRYRCAKLTAQFGSEPTGGPCIIGAEATLYLRNDANQLRLTGGALAAPGWPSLPLGRSRFLIKRDEVDVSLSAHDLVDGKGELAVSGKIDPHSKSAALNVRMDRFPLANMVGVDLAQIVSGRIDGEGMASFDPAEFSSLELVANFKAASAEAVSLVSLPVFAQLGEVFQEAGLGTPVFQSAEGLMVRSSAGCKLSSLRLEQRNLIAINGSMAVDAAGKLSGSLEVGISERLAALATSPQVIATFPMRRDGYRWTSITLGGTAAAPTDSFKLLPAPVDAAPAPAVANPSDRLEREFMELIR